jgi:IS5 family transposase
MRRPSLSDIEYGLRKRTTKRDEFLHIMNSSIPWEEWVAS